MSDTEYDINQLRELTGIEPRNVYFYVQQGLLPRALGAGLAARYGEEHLMRLRAIRMLKTQGLRLDQIRVHFEKLSPTELRRQVEKWERGGKAAGPTALAGRRRFLSAPIGAKGAAEPEALLHSLSFGPPAAADPLRAETVTRITLGPGIELHVTGDARGRVAGRLDEIVHAIQRALIGGSTPRA